MSDLSNPPEKEAMLKMIIAAQDAASAAKVQQQIVDSVPAAAPANEDDIFESLKAHFKSKDAFWRSKKFYASVAGYAISVALPVLTGAVTWPMALAGVIGTGVVYMITQAGVDKASATALGNVATQAITAKMGKKS